MAGELATVFSDQSDSVSDHPRSADRSLWVAAVVVVGIGVAIQAARAVANHWVPADDDAFWAIMARSVFSPHPPLLGSSSSGGVETGTAYHHLGPIAFYLLAPFVVALGGVGLAVGTAVINGVSTIVAAVAVRSGVGIRAGWFVLIGGALLHLAMGSEVLVDPWNPNLATLPLWCALCCTWAVIGGGQSWAPVGVFAASVALQTHLTFAPLSAVVGLTLFAITLYRCVTNRRSADQSFADRKPADRAASDTGSTGEGPNAKVSSSVGSVGQWAPMFWLIGVGLLANFVALYQQFFASGPGNLTNALAGGSDGGEIIGLRNSIGIHSWLMSPATWLPGRWSTNMIEFVDLPSMIPAMLLVIVVAAVVVTTWRNSSRKSSHIAAFAFVILMVGIIGTAITTRVLFGVPMDFVRASLLRWGWVSILFVYLVLAEQMCRSWAGSPLSTRFRRWFSARIDPHRGTKRTPFAMGTSFGMSGVALLVIVGLVAGNVPPRDEGSGAIPLRRDAINQMLAEAGPIVASFQRPYIKVGWTVSFSATPALMAWLYQHGHRFSVDDEVVLRQAGQIFRRNGTEDATVAILSGPAVLSPLEGYERVFIRQPLSDADVKWYRQKVSTVESNLEELGRLVETDPEHFEKLGVLRLGRNPDRESWDRPLCFNYPWRPEVEVTSKGAELVEEMIISDADRERLCDMQSTLLNDALSVEIGPPPS